MFACPEAVVCNYIDIPQVMNDEQELLVPAEGWQSEQKAKALEKAGQ